jgi:hypothetical protein
MPLVDERVMAGAWSAGRPACCGWRAFVQRRVVGAASTDLPHSTLTVSAAQRACHRIWITAFAPLGASGGSGSWEQTSKTAGQCGFRWGERGDSNPRHPGPQLSALANESPVSRRLRCSQTLPGSRSPRLTAPGGLSPLPFCFQKQQGITGESHPGLVRRTVSTPGQVRGGPLPVRVKRLTASLPSPAS